MRNKWKVAGLVLLALLPVIMLVPRNGVWTSDDPFGSQDDGRIPYILENHIRENMPFRSAFQKLGVNLRFMGGKREQNGVFIAEDRLVKNIDPPGEGVVERNNSAVAELAGALRDSNVPVYFCLIPTASGVLQKSLPRHARILDQRQVIDNIYSEMTGRLTTVDAYLPLYTNQNQYVYYRTEDNLTAHGGYYVYAAMAKRMRVSENPSYNYFDLKYASNSFYGDLYRLSPVESIEADSLMLFRYSRHTREYTVAHWGAGEEKLYHTLYPEHLLDLDRGMDIYLGGTSGVVDIKTSAPFDRSLLVLGDKTALAYLPFLANHYGQVTFVDLFHDTAFERGIRPEEYDQVLMAYSVETYTSPLAAPARVSAFVEE